MSHNSNNKLVVRYAPSPTGELHIGNIRAFLYNFLLAKHHERNGGHSEIYMRFEDTDRERSDMAHEQTALEALEALGITFDHGPYRQSERQQLYVDAIGALIDSGYAYVGEETKDGSGNVIRFKNPNKTVTFTDAIRGEISIDTTDFGDFIIARSLESPLYHLTVVVDDIDMGVTHVIRGEDHITSTPRQMLLIEALGGTVPEYAHLPLIIGEDKKKLSKRHGAVTYQSFAELGYLPEAIINYLALLGWSAGDDREFYTLDELIDAFSLAGVSKSPAMFSYHKLDSMNRHYILKLSESDFSGAVYEHLTSAVRTYLDNADAKVRDYVVHTVIRERISKWSDVQDVCDTDLSWLAGINDIDTTKLVWKKSTPEQTHQHLQHVIELLGSVSESAWLSGIDADGNSAIKGAIWDYAGEVGRGDVLWPMRYALTGADRSPDPFTVAFILGKSETLARLRNAYAQVVL